MNCCHYTHLFSSSGFGGWDGQRDLSDLWAYHVSDNRWRLISADTQLQGGPSPRSCHKMCLDEKSGCIYLLGRYIDYDSAHHSEAVPADSMAHVARSAGAASSLAALPVTPSSSTARTTRANFLARYPESIARDIHMILADTTSQTDDVGMEGAGVGGQSTAARATSTAGATGSRGSTPAPASNSEASPLLMGGGFADSIGRSPRASSRLQSSVRSDSQQRPPSLSSPPPTEERDSHHPCSTSAWPPSDLPPFPDFTPNPQHLVATVHDRAPRRASADNPLQAAKISSPAPLAAPLLPPPPPTFTSVTQNRGQAPQPTADAGPSSPSSVQSAAQRLLHAAQGGEGASSRRPDNPRMRSSIACARCRRSKVKCVNNGVGTV